MTNAPSGAGDEFPIFSKEAYWLGRQFSKAEKGKQDRTPKPLNISKRLQQEMQLLLQSQKYIPYHP